MFKRQPRSIVWTFPLCQPQGSQFRVARPAQEAPKFDAKAAIAQACALAGVSACSVTFTDGLIIAGNIPDDMHMEGLSAVAPPMLKKLEKHMCETQLGPLTCMTVHGEKSPVTFFSAGNLCLTAVHNGCELSAESRRELCRITQELSRTYPQRRLPMSIINYASREIQFKIVYYGPALCGKTTNLGYIHQRINPENRGDLVSLATAADRTLFFDFLPLNAVVIKGFVTKFQLYTVPGQVIYNATRQLVLRSVDGIVFVADSQWEKMEENVESFKNLEENLAKQNISIDEIPYVLQYNKRDLQNIAPVNYLEYVLNNRKKRRAEFRGHLQHRTKCFRRRSTPFRRFCCTNSANKAMSPKTAPAPVAIPAEPHVAQKQSESRYERDPVS